MSEAPVFYDHHNHSFCVDASCECGVMISGYVQHLRSRLAAGDAEIERLQHSNDSIHLAASTNAADYAREKARAEKAERERDEIKADFEKATDAYDECASGYLIRAQDAEARAETLAAALREIAFDWPDGKNRWADAAEIAARALADGEGKE